MPVLQDVTLVPRGLMPVKGHNLHEEIACYSLPYGALGFVSHFLTYYTIACLYAGRSPLWPFREVKYSKLDLCLGFGGLALSTGLAIFTLVKCRNTWQLLVIAVWKLGMSLLNGITAVQVAALVILNNGSGNKSVKAAWWIILYIPGMLAGMAGLMSLVIQNAQGSAVMKLTIGFYCIVGFGVAIFGLGLCINLIKKKKKTPQPTLYYQRSSRRSDDRELFLWGMGGFAFSLTAFTILAAFYCDWALGMMTHNLIGLPSGDHSGLYWSYFFAKRLTMFSW